jgi:uncharacterized protein YuzE
MSTLVEALPDLVRDLESPLLRIGRADVVDQLREVEIERWTYDEFADAVYLHLRSPRTLNVADEKIVGTKHGETVSVYDDLGVNLDLDDHRRLMGIEILDGRAIASRLGGDIAV